MWLVAFSFGIKLSSIDHFVYRPDLRLPSRFDGIILYSHGLSIKLFCNVVYTRLTTSCTQGYVPSIAPRH